MGQALDVQVLPHRPGSAYVPTGMTGTPAAAMVTGTTVTGVAAVANVLGTETIGIDLACATGCG